MSPWKQTRCHWGGETATLKKHISSQSSEQRKASFLLTCPTTKQIHDSISGHLSLMLAVLRTIPSKGLGLSPLASCYFGVEEHIEQENGSERGPYLLAVPSSVARGP